jgi:hypothetical protein
MSEQHRQEKGTPVSKGKSEGCWKTLMRATLAIILALLEVTNSHVPHTAYRFCPPYAPLHVICSTLDQRKRKWRLGRTRGESAQIENTHGIRASACQEQKLKFFLSIY